MERRRFALRRLRTSPEQLMDSDWSRGYNALAYGRTAAVDSSRSIASRPCPCSRADQMLHFVHSIAATLGFVPGLPPMCQASEGLP